MSTGAHRLFTREEVNALIPKLSDIVGRAMDHQRQALALKEHLEEEGARIQQSGGGLIDRRDWKARAERLDGLGIELRAAVEAIEGMGGVIKGLDQGLVDFPGRVAARGDEVVNLCWKHGETAVRFWHGMDEGFAGRKPLP
jgi:hypothetical protein